MQTIDSARAYNTPQYGTVNAENTKVDMVENRMRREKGFSLIELLIVVAIILIIAAIAIPSLIRAKVAANESSAAASVRDIVGAEVAYAAGYPAIGYTALPNLGGPGTGCVPAAATACILDSGLSAGTKSGYQFTAVGTNPNPINTTYLIDAWPLALNQTGVKGFCATEDNVVRFTTPSAGSAAYATCLTYSSIGN